MANPSQSMKGFCDSRPIFILLSAWKKQNEKISNKVIGAHGCYLWVVGPSEKNLTLDNLQKRGRIVVNGCPMCLTDEESVDHLLLNRKTAQFIWRSVVEWFDCCWVFPSPCQISSRLGRLLLGLLEEKNYGDFPFLLPSGQIWKERNSRCFEGVGTNERRLVQTKTLVALWVSISLTFKGYSSHQIMQH